jgi:hypothetical protein
VTPQGFQVVDMVPGLTGEALQAQTGAKLIPMPATTAA